LLQAGRLADSSGPYKLYKLGIKLFIAGMLLSTLAPSIWLLVAARGLAAASQALMGPAAVALVIKFGDKGKESESIGRWGLYTAVAGFTSPLLVTQLISIFSWRALFGLQVPIGLFVLYCLATDHESEEISKPFKIDKVGSVLTIVGLSCLILPIVKSGDWGLVSLQSLSLFSTALLLLSILIRRSLTLDNSPLQTQLFTHRNFCLACIMSLFAGIAFYAHWLAILLFMVEIWKFTLIEAGLLLTIMPASMSLFSVWFGKLADKRGYRLIVVPGLIIYSLLFLIMWINVDQDPQPLIVIPALIGSGIGMASVWPTLTSIGANAIEGNSIGSGTSIIHTIQRIGGALGIAIVLAVISALSESSAFVAHRSAILVMPIAGAMTLLLSGFLDNPQRDLL
tara:strand:- start:289 stop:1476 length:1188 start_codon:yes stop_codon:yes gene_type:complete